MSQLERKKVIEKSALGYFSDKIKAWASNLLNDKVDKVTGKQLSTEDYTSAEKTKLASAVTISAQTLSAAQQKQARANIGSCGQILKISTPSGGGSLPWTVEDERITENMEAIRWYVSAGGLAGSGGLDTHNGWLKVYGSTTKDSGIRITLWLAEM